MSWDMPDEEVRVISAPSWSASKSADVTVHRMSVARIQTLDIVGDRDLGTRGSRVCGRRGTTLRSALATTHAAAPATAQLGSASSGRSITASSGMRSWANDTLSIASTRTSLENERSNATATSCTAALRFPPGASIDLRREARRANAGAVARPAAASASRRPLRQRRRRPLRQARCSAQPSVAAGSRRCMRSSSLPCKRFPSSASDRPRTSPGMWPGRYARSR